MYLILKVAYKVVTGSGAEDVRSDEDDTDIELEEEEKKKKKRGGGSRTTNICGKKEEVVLEIEEDKYSLKEIHLVHHQNQLWTRKRILGKEKYKFGNNIELS